MPLFERAGSCRTTDKAEQLRRFSRYAGTGNYQSAFDRKNKQVLSSLSWKELLHLRRHACWKLTLNAPLPPLSDNLMGAFRHCGRAGQVYSETILGFELGAS